jgi:hypothetical protein
MYKSYAQKVLSTDLIYRPSKNIHLVTDPFTQKCIVKFRSARRFLKPNDPNLLIGENVYSQAR